MIKRSLAALAALVLTGSLFAEEYTNSVSGPIVSIDANTIVMTQGKGKEKYVIRRNADSKVEAGLKVGDVIQVEYYMTATTAGPKKEKEKKEKAPKKEEAKKEETKKEEAAPAKDDKKKKKDPAPAPAKK